MVAIFGSDGAIFIFDALDFVLIFEMMEHGNAVSQALCRQPHAEPSSSATQQTKHPSVSAVDTMQFSVEALHTLLYVPGLANRTDFVNLTKKSIDTLFVTPTIIKKVGGPANLMSPPKNNRRTVG